MPAAGSIIRHRTCPAGGMHDPNTQTVRVRPLGAAASMTGTAQQLALIGDCILSNRSTPAQQQAALEDFASLCSGIGGVQPDPCFDAWSGDSLLDSGVAISPQAAAHCVADYRRSVVYIRGVHAALQALQGRFTAQPLQILYAGCGPYATLLLPLLHRFEPCSLQVVLLDIHPQSLASVARLIDACGLDAHSLSLVQANACDYQPAAPLHLLMVEAMQKALEQEPQVAITRRLAPLLVAGGVLVPEAIEVELVLGSGARQHSLGPVLSLGAAVNLAPVRVHIPALAALPELSASLLTRIQVYGEHRLAPGEAEITLPRPFPELASPRAGDSWEIEYRLGSYPWFEARPVIG